MKDYFKIKQDKYRKYYYNEKDEYHRLTGPACEWYGGDKSYCINGMFYMFYDKKNNKLYISTEILKLTSEYGKYIKQNIKDLIDGYNPKIELLDLNREEINQLPDWLNDLIIL